MLAARVLVRKLGWEWYALGKIGPYTFAPYKVVWREQADQLTAAVISSGSAGKQVVPDHKLKLVPFEAEDAAHYVCGVLNSSLVRLVVKGYVVETSTSVHVMEHIGVPAFEARSGLHLAGIGD